MAVLARSPEPMPIFAGRRRPPARPRSTSQAVLSASDSQTTRLSPSAARSQRLETGSLLALQRLAGNAAVASLIEASAGSRHPSTGTIQRCGQHACEGSCTGYGEEQSDVDSLYVERVVQRDPDTKKPPNAAPEELKPLCDFDTLRKTIPDKGDIDPTPGAKDAIDDADVEWVDGINPPGLAKWLIPQIDMPYTVSTFEKRAEAWVARCEAPALNKVKWIKDAAKKAAAQQTLAKQLDLDKAELTKVVSEYSTKTTTGRMNYRKSFLRTMRCLLGPDPATRNHFSALEEVTPGLWLDGAAAARMRQVRTALQAAGHDIPSTDVGQGLRGHHLSKHQTGWWGHALGFSIDFFAYENPHITDPRTSRLIQMLTGDADRMKFTDDKGKEMDYFSRRAVIKSIGEKSAAGEDPTTDPKFARFLDQVDEQYLRMTEGSRKMQEDTSVLPAENRHQLEQLKHDYVDLYEQILAARSDVATQQKALDAAKKTTRAKLVKVANATGVKAGKIEDATVEADPDVEPLVKKLAKSRAKKDNLEVRQKALKDRLPTIFKPWLDRIKKESLDLDAAAAKEGLVAAQLPDLKGWRFNEIEAVLEQMAARESQVPADKRTTDPQLKSMRARSQGTWRRSLPRPPTQRPRPPNLPPKCSHMCAWCAPLSGSATTGRRCSHSTTASVAS